VRVTGDLLACKAECIPATFTLVRDVDEALRGGGRASVVARRELFERFERRVPVTVQASGLDVDVRYSQSAVRPGDRFTADLVVRGAREATFFPEAIEGLELRMLESGADPARPGAFVVRLEGVAGPDDLWRDQRLAGVLSVRGPNARESHVEVDLLLPRARAGAAVEIAPAASLAPASAEERFGVGLLHVLVLAFVGGLILNLMPCVLPVLAIKLFSIAELAGRSRRELLAHGAAYSAGVLATMLALAALVAGLRAAGTRVGWGFQFQEPGFALAISAVLVVFALNLFGVFEIAQPGGRIAELGEQAVGARRSFFEGLLAVVLATPCSAPFLGTAVGFAFASPGAWIFAIFALVGAGLAFPYALATLVPATARLVPRSGAWMLRLRALLGWTLLATVVWLLSLLGSSAGIDGLVSAVAFLLAIAFATWVYGARQHAGALRALAPSLGVALVALVALNPMRMQAEPAPEARETPADAPQRFEREAVRASLREGRPAFVYFTADWCITCGVNERLVLSTERVQAELRRRDYAVFRADWTRRDEAIRAELARFGKAGVPMYLVYDPAKPDDPRLLPELLTVDTVLAALAGGDAAVAR
jgi:thiol:disulfide interchange protein DsbD